MALDLRPLLIGLRDGRALPPRRCDACGSATREGKRYCSDHVEAHPYVVELAARIAQREADVDAITRRGVRAIRPDCPLLDEVVAQLTVYGTRTLERVCREVSLSFAVVNALTAYLARRRVVAFGLTKRGSTTVRLVHPQRASA